MRKEVRYFTDSEVRNLLTYTDLISTMSGAFRRATHSPERPHFNIKVPDGSDGTLLLMPAWNTGGNIGIKTVTVFPDNVLREKPSVNAQYLLFSASSGELKAIFDAKELTLRRTAAASALASSYLSKRSAKRLLIVGTGNLSTNLALAHSAVRPIEEILIWGRNPQKAKQVANALSEEGFNATESYDLKGDVGRSDIISCCTLSKEPIIKGEWLVQGTHIDLVGAFTPAMREVDDDCLRKSSIFVDTREGALKEAGELVQGISNGVITEVNIRGCLADLVTNKHKGRSREDEVTLFKSVGCSLEDLAAAERCFDLAQ